MPPQPRHLQSHPSERDDKRAHPPPAKPEKQQPPDPPHPTRPTRRTQTKHPRHPPSHHYHRPTRTRHPHHPPSRHRHRPRPKRTQGFEKGAKVQQPFRNDHTGDWIWCEGTIQYRLKGQGDNGGPQIRVIWHRQKELDQGNSAPDQTTRRHPGTHQRPPHPAPHRREQGPHRHQIHWGAPPGVEPRPPPAAPTQTPTNRQKVPSPQSPSLTGQGPRAQASTAPARPHRGHRQPPRPQPPGRHILQGRHNRPPRAPDGTGAGVGPPPPHLPGTRPTTRRPPGNHPHVYPGPESVQMLLAQGGPPYTPKPASTSTSSTTSASQGG